MPLEYLSPETCNLEKLLALKEANEAKYEQKGNHFHRDILKHLPAIKAKLISGKASSVVIGTSDELTTDAQEEVIKIAKDLIPWKKGPFNLFGTEIDAEWRSDLKWDRLKEHVNLKGKRVLDIGCHNGYFMFRMLEDSPVMVLGIDPVIPCATQFRFLNHFIEKSPLHFELFGVQDLVHFKNAFDTIFSMGILYHHRNPITQLIEMREALDHGGELILETIGIAGEGSYSLFPEDRYAKMKNVWFLPTLECLVNWLRRAKFVDIEVIDVTKTTPVEQRKTDWCPEEYQSLEDFLDKDNDELTIEGHPAPVRFLLKAFKKPLR